MFKKSYLDLLIKDELNRFIKANGENAIRQTNTKDFVRGNVVVKVPLNRKAITDLLAGARNIHKDLSQEDLYNIKRTFGVFSNDGLYGRLAYKNLFKDTTRRIIQVAEKMSFEDALNMTIKFRNKLGSKFYGVLFKVDGMSDTLINPFHILTALSSVSEYGQGKAGVMDVKNHKFFPIIYILDKEEELDILYHSIYADLEKIDTNINCLMHVFGSKTQTKTKITGTNIENLDDEKLNKIKNGSMNIEIKYIQTIDDSASEEETERSNNYVIAHQLMAEGVVCPYYGASLAKINDSLTDCKGTRLTPMPTVNIAGAVNNFDSVVFDNVCTGASHRNTTLDGLRTQTHVNYSSPYGSSKTLMPGSLVYARRMIEKSLQVYRTVGLFNFEEPEDVAIDYDELINKTIQFSKKKLNNKYGKVDKIYTKNLFDYM